ncbi:hypothetical protein [Pseudoxanthomonas mexicana]|jgi:hypothetical protein
MAVSTSTGYEALILGPHAFDAIFFNGTIEVRSGVQPASADLAPTGTLLGRITADGGAWSPGNPANGLRFTRDGRYAMKNFAQRWVLQGLATGTAGWCRLLPNAADPGEDSLLHPRIDGAVGLSDAPGDVQLFLPSLAITPSTFIELPSWWFMQPQ